MKKVIYLTQESLNREKNSLRKQMFIPEMAHEMSDDYG